MSAFSRRPELGHDLTRHGAVETGIQHEIQAETRLSASLSLSAEKSVVRYPCRFCPT